jgi:hypothetical protein
MDGRTKGEVREMDLNLEYKGMRFAARLETGSKEIVFRAPEEMEPLRWSRPYDGTVEMAARIGAAIVRTGRATSYEVVDGLEGVVRAFLARKATIGELRRAVRALGPPADEDFPLAPLTRAGLVVRTEFGRIVDIEEGNGTIVAP